MAKKESKHMMPNGKMMKDKDMRNMMDKKMEKARKMSSKKRYA